MHSQPTRRALHTVLRVRQMELDLAKQVLAARIAAMRQAEQEAIHEQLLLARAGEHLGSPAFQDFVMEAATRWFPVARRNITAAWAAFDRRQAATALARADLAKAWAASQAVEDLIARDQAERRLQEEHSMQAALDEIGQRRGSG